MLADILSDGAFNSFRFYSTIAGVEIGSQCRLVGGIEGSVAGDASRKKNRLCLMACIPCTLLAVFSLWLLGFNGWRDSLTNILTDALQIGVVLVVYEVS